jgi:hypothetical protein
MACEYIVREGRSDGRPLRKSDGGAAGVPLRAGEGGDEGQIVTYPSTKVFDCARSRQAA